MKKVRKPQAGSWVNRLMGEYIAGRVAGPRSSRVRDLDYTPQLQAAIDALPLDGGVVQLPPGIFELTKPIEIGDGKPFRPSTRHGVRLVGSGHSIFGHNSATVLVRSGDNKGAMINVNGPIEGVEIAHLTLDGRDVSHVGIQALSHRGCSLHDMSVLDFKFHGLHLNTHKGDDPQHGSFSCSYRDLQLVSTSLTSTGIYLHGDPKVMINATQSTFDTVFVYYHGGPASAGVYLQFTDGHLFNNLHVVGSVDKGGPCVLFDGQDAIDGFPGGNTFVCPAFSPNGVTGMGVIGPNQFVSFDDTNGAPIPTYPGLLGTTRTGVRFGNA